MKKKNVNKVEKHTAIKERPPIVVVLGHVDHGKTTLLDTIRKTNVIGGESGGITQHIGAYQTEFQGKKITLIDTPGHEAFSQMRSRGARVADIAILVVAAEEGIKPQTKEVISHIKEFKMPVVVAVNKIDKAEANPGKVIGELAKEGIVVESQGGNVPSVNISAKNGQGIDNLLELLLLVAEMEELKADYQKPASGVVIESRLDSRRGSTASLLVREGVLSKGDIIVCGHSYGKIRILEDFQGNSIETAPPSTPVVVLGLNQAPTIGEKFNVTTDFPRQVTPEPKIAEEKEPKIVEEKKEEKPAASPEDKQAGPPQSESLGGEGQNKKKKIFNVILKADVQGSLEAIKGSLAIIEQEDVELNILKSEIGDVSEFDTKLAYSTKSIIIGFRIKASSFIFDLAKRQGVKIKTFEVIYELIEEIKKGMTKLLEAEIVREDLGKLKVIAIFRKEKSRMIIGGKVSSGKIENKTLVDIIRGDEKIGTGRITQLQHNKKDATEVEKGKEAGILLEGNPITEEGDILEVYREKERKREL